MIYAIFGEDYWELRHKVTFDGPNKLIVVNSDVSEINVQVEIYSDWKEWASLRDYLKYDAAIRVVGGDPTPTGFLGASFFLINGWQIVVSETVNFTGNLYSDDFPSPITTEGDTQLTVLTVSNLIDKTTPPDSDNARIFV